MEHTCIPAELKIRHYSPFETSDNSKVLYKQTFFYVTICYGYCLST